MNDFRELKAIAEACQQHQPLRFMRSHGALYIRNDNGIVFDVHQNRSFPDFLAQNKDYADLVLAASPATVLALIGENERVKARLCVCRDCGGQGEVYSGHDSYQGHNQPPEPDMDVCGTCGGDGVLGPLEDFEALVDERDQLKVENEALRTKLEKPDPILIQCMDTAIVEQDQLEKDAARYRWLREDRSGYIEVVEWIGPHATGMTGEDLDALLDAAMGKGERS
ncbi:hypothetical protein GIW77_24365 [Pseudomonas simiae]|uniref:Uncharacterized protein n=1 Tax=Pseudomonas simiae TaxID=321846 RepID=A0ABS9G8X9_9PSED|nr:hypothetical protein [Pseudomonas simiae]MCF5049329.1 hypothetical protein [Pseudomonas simiae]MCF5188062.1 hypothetical protein [Pseudomonas simiae]MCF5286942.1 hypothetical protein [Pseudomonas simiae]MCF5319988.1 hypothetical protein [Pseudomonas simiae]MCF5336882.1 hypothetical protein [Pseudomonas simiae]